LYIITAGQLIQHSCSLLLSLECYPDALSVERRPLAPCIRLIATIIRGVPRLFPSDLIDPISIDLSRYTANAFLRLELDQALEKRQMPTAIYERTDQAPVQLK
jgi:hypothetical protein